MVLKGAKSSALSRQVLHCQLDTLHGVFCNNLGEILINSCLLIKSVSVDEVSNICSAESHDFPPDPLKN